MKASKTLSKPVNWPDFESVCTKLWGEIWNCPEIKKNGRAGQNQNGVDIYGVPEGETSYYGIQCKGKDEYTHKKLKRDEVLSEIEKAKGFKPALKKFYIATTANKDAAIEEYVRELDLQNRQQGLFEVHLFSWEDIAERLFENKKALTFFLDQNQFYDNHRVVLSVNGYNESFVIKPEYEKLIYVDKLSPFVNHAMVRLMRHNRSMFPKDRVNKSYVPISVTLENTGNTMLEDLKVYLDFDDGIVDITEENIQRNGISVVIRQVSASEVFIIAWEKRVELEPSNPKLLSEDSKTFKMFYIKPSHKAETSKLKWKLLSKNFNSEGEIDLNIEPTIHLKEVLKESEDKEETITNEISENEGKFEIQDHITDLTDEND